MTGTPRSTRRRSSPPCPTAFELDGAAAGFLEHARGRSESLLLRRLITTERQIDHDQRALAAAHHCVALQDHHIQRHRHGAFKPVHHHAEEVADQDDVAIAVEDARRVRVVGCQTHDRLGAFAGADVRRGQPPDVVVHRHEVSVRVPACRTPAPR